MHWIQIPNYSFSLWKFSRTAPVRKFVSEYYSGTKIFLHWNFIIWLVANGCSFLDHGNSVPDARVGALSRVRQLLSNSHCPSIFVHMIATQAAKYSAPLFQRFWWKRTVILLTASIRSSLLLNLDKCSLWPLMCIQNFLNWKYFQMVTLIQNLFLTKYFHTKIRWTKKANYSRLQSTRDSFKIELWLLLCTRQARVLTPIHHLS